MGVAKIGRQYTEISTILGMGKTAMGVAQVGNCIEVCWAESPATGFIQGLRTGIPCLFQ